MLDQSLLSFPEWLDVISRRLNRPFDILAKERLDRYVALLKIWNEKVNLTAITDDEGIAIRHILDSLTLLEPIERLEHEQSLSIVDNRPVALRIVDVGTGAGFPGLPLKIVHPEWEMLLLDSLAKRLRFLDAVIGELQLEGIRTWHDRAEDAGRRRELREQFDIVTARAVASLPVLCEYCLPLVRINGLFLAMKSNLESEWPAAEKAVSMLGGKMDQIMTFTLPGTDMQRSIMIIRKVGHTPQAYPRKAGIPEKQPL